MQIENYASKLRKHHHFEKTRAANTLNTTKYRNVLQVAQTTTEPLQKLTMVLLQIKPKTMGLLS